MTGRMAAVALTEKHRNEIYRHLAPTWGDEVTQAFLSQFPAREGDEPITRDFLRAELATLRTEMSDQRGELRAEMADLRADLNRMGSRLAGLLVGVAGVLTAVIALT